MFSVKWLRDTAERALSTAAQFALTAFGADKLNVLDADWRLIGGAALSGAVLTVLKAVIASNVGSQDSASLDPSAG